MVIHIIWSDAVSFDSVAGLVHDTDFGIYSVYGICTDQQTEGLAYIGRALGGSFGWRVPQHVERFESELRGPIHVRFGRLAGLTTPSDAEWNRQIELAERLLIFAHQPPLNRQVSLGNLEPDLQSIHVCNWGYRGSILPEVSGLRWTAKGEDAPKNLYSTTNQSAENPSNSGS